MNICFAGHSQVAYGGEVQKKVLTFLSKLLTDDMNFYSGGMGDFDHICERAVRELKRQNPDKAITLSLVLPSYSYAKNKMIYKEWKYYDDVFVCGASDLAHYKARIKVRNRWMVDNSSCLIGYIKDFYNSGANETLKYAKRKELQIYNIAEI